jgi:hypothetical protein
MDKSKTPFQQYNKLNIAYHLPPALPPKLIHQIGNYELVWTQEIVYISNHYIWVEEYPVFLNLTGQFTYSWLLPLIQTCCRRFSESG